ncbi:MAG: UDP-N-acetylmuramoyl-tripeptide--D-alanyl-D-alanine ligase [Bacteroidota bacterium]
MSSPAPLTTEQLYDYYLAHPQVTTDSRKVPPLGLFIALKGDRFDGNQYAQSALDKGASYAVVDDAVVAAEIGEKALLVTDGLLALQRLANHHRRQLKMPILALTGSNGKTTTKELIASVMAQRYRIHYTQGNFNNHIGLPLTILAIGPDVEMAILEIGANHQREIADLCRIAEPTHGLITNIGEAHLEGFGGIEGVKIGKGELYDFLAANKGIAFVNLDAEFLPEMAERVPRRINYVTAETPSKEEPNMETKLLAITPNVKVAFLNEEGGLTEVESHLPGAHNFENIKAAVAVGKYFKVASHDIAAGIRKYQPKNNRSQRETYRGVDFFMDAYNANPSSTSAALRAFVVANEAPRAAILGDMLELGQESRAAHLRIAELATSLTIEQLILVGPQYQQLADQVEARYFVNTAALKSWFWEQDWTDYTILVKGSRGIKLEDLLSDD